MHTFAARYWLWLLYVGFVWGAVCAWQAGMCSGPVCISCAVDCTRGTCLPLPSVRQLGCKQLSMQSLASTSPHMLPHPHPLSPPAYAVHLLLAASPALSMFLAMHACSHPACPFSLFD